MARANIFSDGEEDEEEDDFLKNFKPSFMNPEFNKFAQFDDPPDFNAFGQDNFFSSILKENEKKQKKKKKKDKNKIDDQSTADSADPTIS